MAKKKKVMPEPEDDEVPDGVVDEDGDEVLDLDAEKDDDLYDDIEYDLSQIEDDMLADENEDEEFGPEIDDVIKMLRAVKCAPCPGSKSKVECQIRHDYGCPPDKAEKFVPKTEAERRKKVK
ncbi:MAG: hypothetical protein JW891_05475 [Candidatus Lokiarchaeota archaeon]|nr:hypothetical protein [Candidatus Lokiarchaeota archaeon]